MVKGAALLAVPGRDVSSLVYEHAQWLAGVRESAGTHVQGALLLVVQLVNLINKHTIRYMETISTQKERTNE